MRAEELVIITGVSGSGKSTALNALEDMGYFVVENLPAMLISPFVDFLLNLPSDWEQGSASEKAKACRARKFALAVDCRERAAFAHVGKSVERLRAAGTQVTLFFFDAQDEVLLRRFQETRRPHPLLMGSGDAETLAEAFSREREILAEFRGAADQIIDTSSASPHDLRRSIEKLQGREPTLEITVQTFGFKYGVSQDADLVVDVRFLPNPHFVPSLRELTGLEASIVDYVFQSSDANDFVDRYAALLEFLVPRYQKEGKRYLQIGVGCTGGRHRSVAVGEKLGKRLEQMGHRVTVRHRDVKRQT